MEWRYRVARTLNNQRGDFVPTKTLCYIMNNIFMEENFSLELHPNKIVVRNRGEATEKILQTFKSAQQENYSSLDFHSEKHPETVRRAALEFAKIIMREDPTLVTKNTLEGIVTSAASHDSVLNVAHGEMITRFRGFFESDIKESYRAAMQQAGIHKGNELLSAEYVEREMNKYVDGSGEPIFDAVFKKETCDAIAATFPEFDFSATISDKDLERYFGTAHLQEAGLEKYRTGIKVWQPHLKPDSSVVTLAVATGDLRGDVVSHNFETFRESGNAEFRELNEGLRQAVQEGIATMPLEKKKKIAESMIRWVKDQVTFAMWQKVLFWESINNNQIIAKSTKLEEIKKALRNRYDTCFDANILTAKERYEHLEKKYGEEGAQRTEHLIRLTDDNFQALLRELGFSL